MFKEFCLFVRINRTNIVLSLSWNANLKRNIIEVGWNTKQFKKISYTVTWQTNGIFLKTILF